MLVDVENLGSLRRLERVSGHSVWSKDLGKGGNSFRGQNDAVRWLVRGQEFHSSFI